MLLFRPFLMLVFLFSWGIAHAQTPTGDADHPCVQEICIGDGMDKLRRIEWNQVDYTSKRVERVRKADRERKARIYRGFGNEGVPSYLIVGVFDGDMLDDMARVKVACEPNEITGSYISSGGHKTNVRVSLMPDETSKAMVWRVVGITRMYPALESRAQRIQLNEDLNARYGRFLNPAPGQGGALIVPMGKETSLSLHWVDLERNKKYGGHALCDKPKRISVD